MRIRERVAASGLALALSMAPVTVLSTTGEWQVNTQPRTSVVHEHGIVNMCPDYVGAIEHGCSYSNFFDFFADSKQTVDFPAVSNTRRDLLLKSYLAGGCSVVFPVVENLRFAFPPQIVEGECIGRKITGINIGMFFSALGDYLGNAYSSFSFRLRRYIPTSFDDID